MPRKPEYLRDSYDLNQLIGSPSSKDSSGHGESKDESQPRIPAPKPRLQSRMQIHPIGRSRIDGSVDFPASSEDESRTKVEFLHCIS